MQLHVTVRIYRATVNMHKHFLYPSEKLSELKGLLRGTAELFPGKTDKRASPTCSPFPEGDKVHPGIPAPFNFSHITEAFRSKPGHSRLSFLNFFFLLLFNQITAMVAETPTGIP